MVNGNLTFIRSKLVLVISIIVLLVSYAALSYSSPAGEEQIKGLLEQECINLNKEKLHTLIESQFRIEVEKGISPDLFKIMEGVIKRTDFDGVSEEKTAEIIGLVNGAHMKGAPLEYIDEIFDVAYVNAVSVDHLFAAANALKDFNESDVPQDVYEEFVYHSIENAWEPAVTPVLARGLIYGVERGLSPQKVALIIMLDVKNGELKKKSPEQLVLDAIKLVREKEPQNWKPMSEVEKETAARVERKKDLEKQKQDIEENMQKKERAIAQAESKLKEMREYGGEGREIDIDRINKDMAELIRSLQSEIAKYQREHVDIVANLETTRKEIVKQKTVKDRERRERREREFAKTSEGISASGKKGRLNRERLYSTVERYLGTPYRFGGDSERGIDCSAFTRRVYRSQNVELPRSSREQARVGRGVAYNSVKTGDLIFFNTSISGVVSHVGVYLGNNVFAHSSSSKGVTKSSLREKYYLKRFVKGGRIFYE